MDIVTLGFLIFGFVALIGAFMLEGGHFLALLAGTAGIIVFGGTIAAVGVSFPSYKLKRVPKMLKVAFGKQELDFPKLIIYFREVAYKTRKEGILSIESDLTDNMDPFIKKGLQLVVDGADPQVVKATLELDVEAMMDRHKDGANIFESAGGYSPTMGIIGTVMGLVHVLGSLSDPSSLGPKIAVAFIATLYGVSFANLLWLPIATKLKNLNDDEVRKKSLIIEAILCIQDGINPSAIAERLKGFLDKNQLLEFNKLNKGE